MNDFAVSLGLCETTAFVLTGHAAEVHGCIGSAENQYD